MNKLSTGDENEEVDTLENDIEEPTFVKNYGKLKICRNDKIHISVGPDCTYFGIDRAVFNHSYSILGGSWIRNAFIVVIVRVQYLAETFALFVYDKSNNLISVDNDE